MRLFVVEVSDTGAKGDYETLETFTRRLQSDWARGGTRALDEALLATINIAHVGMVLPHRRGWVFLAEDST